MMLLRTRVPHFPVSGDFMPNGIVAVPHVHKLLADDSIIHKKDTVLVQNCISEAWFDSYIKCCCIVSNPSYALQSGGHLSVIVVGCSRFVY
jgi:hypothetical protein